LKFRNLRKQVKFVGGGKKTKGRTWPDLWEQRGTRNKGHQTNGIGHVGGGSEKEIFCGLNAWRGDGGIGQTEKRGKERLTRQGDKVKKAPENANDQRCAAIGGIKLRRVKRLLKKKRQEGGSTTQGKAKEKGCCVFTRREKTNSVAKNKKWSEWLGKRA